MSTTPPPPRSDIPKLAELPLVIDTPRVQLRPIAETDVDDIFPYASDPEFPRHMSWAPHRDRDETRAWIASCTEALAAGTAVTWAIVHEGRACGTAGLEAIRWHVRAWRVDRADLGYWIAKPLWNQGFATEAATAVTRWGFETLGLHKIAVGCAEDNKPSKRVIEKVGYRYCGRWEDHAWRDGRWWNHLRFELTIGEWGDTARTQRFKRPSRPL